MTCDRYIYISRMSVLIHRTFLKQSINSHILAFDKPYMDSCVKISVTVNKRSGFWVGGDSIVLDKIKKFFLNNFNRNIFHSFGSLFKSFNDTVYGSIFNFLIWYIELDADIWNRRNFSDRKISSKLWGHLGNEVTFVSKLAKINFTVSHNNLQKNIFFIFI